MDKPFVEDTSLFFFDHLIETVFFDTIRGKGKKSPKNTQLESMYFVVQSARKVGIETKKEFVNNPNINLFTYKNFPFVLGPH